MEITIEQAQEVIRKHRAESQEKENVQKGKFIGRYFKYRNSYGTGDEWWLYGTVTKVNEWGHIEGKTFQKTSLGMFEVAISTLMGTIVENGQEISSEEYKTALDLFTNELIDHLRP